MAAHWGVLTDSLQPCGLEPAKLFCPWDSLGKNTEVGCHFLLRGLPDPGIEPTSPTSPALAGRFFTTSATVVFAFVENVYKQTVL